MQLEILPNSQSTFKYRWILRGDNGRQLHDSLADTKWGCRVEARRKFKKHKWASNAEATVEDFKP